MLVLLLVARTVLAFGTINTAGQQAEHERTTRIALQCPDNTYLEDGLCFEPLSMRSFAGGDGSFGAVGAPDGGTDVLESRAHCDDADYIDYAKWGLNGTYPRSKEARNQALIACYSYLKERWDRGIASAAELLDGSGNLKTDEVYLANDDGNEQSCTYIGGLSFRAKCDVYDGLGRAVHGLQDFYAHSNWVDSADIEPKADVPPGLGNTAIAPFLAMNGTGPTADNIPDDFTTGCFNLYGQDTTDGAAACIKEGRLITHVVVNKDKGNITVQPQAVIPDRVLTSNPQTPRGKISQNFEHAVEAAALETRRQWADFRAKLRSQYGDKSKLMICALTRDYPSRDCVPGRRIALIVDDAAAADVGKLFTDSLVSKSKPGSKPADTISVYAPALAYTGDPAGAKMNVSLDVARSIRAANETGVIVIATKAGNVTDIISAIDAARAKGIRVSYGLLVTSEPLARRAIRFFARLLRQEPDNQIAKAVLRTGGSYSVIHNTTDFAQHVLAWGVTSDASPVLLPGITALADSERHFTASKGKVNVTVAAFDGGSAGVSLNEDGKERAKGSGSTVSLQHSADDPVDVHIVPSNSTLYSVSLRVSGSLRPGVPLALLLCACSVVIVTV